MRLGSSIKTLEIDGATFRYKVNWAAKLAFIDISSRVAMSAEAKRKIADARKAGKDLSDEDLEGVEMGELDIAAAVKAFMDAECLVGWEGVTVEGENGEEKPLAFSQQNAREYLGGETLMPLAMDALQKALQGGN